MDVADLAAHDADPVVVELVAEQQPTALALVEADGHDEALAAHDSDRLVEREGRAGALPGDGDTLRAEPALEGRRHVDALGRLDSLEAEVAARP